MRMIEKIEVTTKDGFTETFVVSDEALLKQDPSLGGLMWKPDTLWVTISTIRKLHNETIHVFSAKTVRNVEITWIGEYDA